MKKLVGVLYFVFMSVLVLSLSGCGGSSSYVPNNNSNNTTTSGHKVMSVTSPVFKKNSAYRIYKGGSFALPSGNPKYYVAPVEAGAETVTMNLEFANAFSDDSFVITTSDDPYTIVFGYNKDGTDEPDLTTPQSSTIRNGGRLQKYTGLTVTGAAVDIESDAEIVITLNSDGTATADGTAIPNYNYVWHADPQHPAQYWTLGTDGTTEYTEDEYTAAIEAAGTNSGLYIARDIRYTSNTLNFTTSNTAKKDEDTEYVVYYDSTSSAVKAAIAELGNTYGTAYSSDKYIFATLPSQVAGQGGGTPGGTPPNMGGNSPFNSAADSSISAFSTMTHSASDAYANPVLHITEPGTYRLKGTWNGQIWIEVGAKAEHQVGLILDNVNVTCTVAPALVFYKVYKWAENGGKGYDTQSVLAANDTWKNIGTLMLSDDGYYDVGAIVEIADGSTNTFKGANVYRILELCPKIDDDTELPKYTGSGIGTDISEQEKMYKLDAAFHSRRSIVIGGGAVGTGTLNITSTTCEGLGSEMHMLVESGIISVSAPDDGINTNEDYVSVFAMDGGSLTINSTGGDGIDSNGWVAFNGGTLNITAGSQRVNSAGEAGIDAENGYYIYDNNAYTWSAAGSSNGGGNSNTGGGDNTNTNTNNNNSNTNTDTNTNTNGDTNTNIDTNTNGNNSNTNTNTNGNTTSDDQSGNTTNNNTNGNSGGTSSLMEAVTLTNPNTGATVLTLSFTPVSNDATNNRTGAFPTTSNIFRLVNTVNSFSGITNN